MNEPPRRRGRQQQFITSARCGKIIAAVSQKGSWHGKRGPMRIWIELSDQPTLNDERIAFSTVIYRDRMSGTAGTVREALDRLETIYRERTLEHDARRFRAKATGERRHRPDSATAVDGDAQHASKARRRPKTAT